MLQLNDLLPKADAPPTALVEQLGIVLHLAVLALAKCQQLLDALVVGVAKVAVV